MAIRKEKEEICGRLSTRVVYITEDEKRFSQESEAFLHDEYLKWQQTARKMGVRCVDNYQNYRFSGPDWYFFEHDACKPYPYGYSVKSLTQKKQEFAEWLKKYEEKA